MGLRGKGKGEKGDQDRGGPYSYKVTSALDTQPGYVCALGTRAPQMWAHTQPPFHPTRSTSTGLRTTGGEVAPLGRGQTWVPRQGQPELRNKRHNRPPGDTKASSVPRTTTTTHNAAFSAQGKVKRRGEPRLHSRGRSEARIFPLPFFLLLLLRSSEEAKCSINRTDA